MTNKTQEPKFKVGQKVYSVGRPFNDMIIIQVGKITHLFETEVIFSDTPVRFPLKQIFATKQEALEQFKKWIN